MDELAEFIAVCEEDDECEGGEGDDDGEGEVEEEEEGDEPSDVVLAHAVVDPGAVVVVLGDAGLADVAVVSPLGVPAPALEADLLDGPLVVLALNEGGAGGLLGGGDQKG